MEVVEEAVLAADLIGTLNCCDPRRLSEQSLRSVWMECECGHLGWLHNSTFEMQCMLQDMVTVPVRSYFSVAGLDLWSEGVSSSDWVLQEAWSVVPNAFL